MRKKRNIIGKIDLPTVTRTLAALACLMLTSALLQSVDAAEQEDTSEKWRKWLEEEVVYIISDRERGCFEQLQTDEQRELFVEQFWLERDPTPGTARNEFREDYEERLSHVNDVYARESIYPGWQTPRGEMYLRLGKPRNITPYFSSQYLHRCELWFYEAEVGKGLPPFFYLLFFQHRGSGEMILYNHALHTPNDLFTMVDQDSESYRYNLLKRLNSELAHAAYTYLPDESPALTTQFSSMSSIMLLQQIENARNVGVDAGYGEQILTGELNVTTTYTFDDTPVAFVAMPYVDIDGVSFIDYAFELNAAQVEMGQHEDNFYGAFEIEVALADSGGETVLTKTRPIEINLDKSRFNAIKNKPFIFSDRLACVPGDFLLSVRIKNKVSKKYIFTSSDISVPALNGDAADVSPLMLARGARNQVGERNYMPFEFDTALFLPCPQGIFNKSNPPILNCQIYLAPSLRAEVSNPIPARTMLFNSEGEEIASADLAIDHAHFTAGGTISYVLMLPVESLNLGHYRFSLEVDYGDAGRIQRSVEFDLSGEAQGEPYMLRRDDMPRSKSQALFEYCKALEEQGGVEQARMLYSVALTADPDNRELRLAASELLLREGDYQSVLTLIEQYVIENPNDEYLLRLAAEANLGLEDYGQAAKLLERLMVQVGESTDLLNKLAEAYWRDDQAEKAAETWRRSLELDPDQPEIMEKLNNVGR